MDLLSYLRFKFLDEIGFSANAYILKDPNGVSMGGSGLCATPYDLLKVIYLIANDGVWQGKQLLPAGYVRAAKSMQVTLTADSPHLKNYRAMAIKSG